jgi:hypothetical protein
MMRSGRCTGPVDARNGSWFRTDRWAATPEQSSTHVLLWDLRAFQVNAKHAQTTQR